MTLAALLTERLELIDRWYGGMVSATTGRLEYLYLPQTDGFVRGTSPIRDIASVWDLEVLERFLHRHTLRGVVETSLAHFRTLLVSEDGCLILDPRRLAEPSSIAHSTFLLLALLDEATQDLSSAASLAEGLYRQQRPDGSFKVYFQDLPDEGAELYAGEAMLGLMEAFRHLRDPRYLRSVEAAFRFYDAHYFRGGRVGADMLVFFANWQSQACRLLFECSERDGLRQVVADYLGRMHDRIIDQGFYEAVERSAERQASVEVACAVEGLAEAYSLACGSNEGRAERFRRALGVALAYLVDLPCTDACTDKERGGFGMSLADRSERIDVTGHVASAFVKSVTAGIECPAES